VDASMRLDVLYRGEERAAWREYLGETRRHQGDSISYELVEPRCWDRLVSRLEAARLAYLHRKGTGR
jgi:hypothetical protein